MRINLIWINLFSIIYAVNIGASDNDNLNIYDDDDHELNYNEMQSGGGDGETARNFHRHISSSTETLSSPSMRVTADVEDRDLRKVFEQMSTATTAKTKLQVESEKMNNEERNDDDDDEVESSRKAKKNRSKTKATTRKRKSFLNKKRRKKRRKQQEEQQVDGDDEEEEQQKKIIHGVKNENFELRNVGSRRIKNIGSGKRERGSRNNVVNAMTMEGSNYVITTTMNTITHSSLADIDRQKESKNNHHHDNSGNNVNKSTETALTTESSTTDEIVMEMVEAIIDNNNNNNNNEIINYDSNNSIYEDNTSSSSGISSSSDVNLWKVKSENENLEFLQKADNIHNNNKLTSIHESTSSSGKNVKRNKNDEKLSSSGDAKSVKMENSNDGSNSRSKSETNEVKINKRLNQSKKSSSTNSSNRSRRKRRKIIIGDLSCMKAEFIQAPRVANADIKYIRNELYGIERSFLEAEYHCHTGYKLIKKSKQKVTIVNRNLVCRRRRWIGQKPVCNKIRKSSSTKTALQQCDSYEAQKCEQLCIKSGNRTEATCQCHKGFHLIGTRCLDINECEEAGDDVCGEHGKCINLIGTHRCLCQQGFQLDNKGKCVDINECLLRGGHGPCQDTCLNTLGGYTCTCENLKGTKLSTDGHSCEEIDLCSINNGGCSHTCHNTIGQAFCSCPEGFKLDIDWKTCIDIDECQLQQYSSEQKCNYECINTMGSYKCIESRDIGADQPFPSNDFDDYMIQQNNNNDDYKMGSEDTDGNYDIIDGASFVSECSNGFYFNETIGDCQDINECEIDNGNCSNNGTCVNTNGSFYCSCHKGFVLSEDDKYKCIEVQHKNVTMESPLNRITVACPPLFPPVHGYLECTRPLESSNTTGDDVDGGRVRVINRPGSQCQLRCPTSYRASGTYLKTCGEDGKWHGYDDGICIKYPTPKLICPSNQLVELPQNSDKVQIKLQKPKTDVNFKRDVTIKPSWIKSLEKISLELGTLNITYTAKHPISKLTVACTTTLFVVDGEAPVVEYCPASQKHKIEKHNESIKAFWIEPKFSDNVKVTDVTQTNHPGTLFGLGSHQIIYEARDAAGYKSRCTFKIIVNAPKHSGLKLPIKNNKFYY